METKDMLKEVLLKYKGPLGQLLTNLAGDDGDEVLTELNKFNRKELCYAAKNLTLESKMNFRKKQSILRCISQGKNLSLRPLDGSRLICNANTTFKVINPNLIALGFNKIGVATLKTPVQVHKIMIGGSTFMDIFHTLPGTWAQKWLSQNQVIEFCETLIEWLAQKERATVFLAKKDENKPINENNPSDNLDVFYVGVLSDGLSVSEHRLESTYVGGGMLHLRLVSPKLTKRISIPSAV